MRDASQAQRLHSFAVYNSACGRRCQIMQFSWLHLRVSVWAHSGRLEGRIATVQERAVGRCANASLEFARATGYCAQTSWRCTCRTEEHALVTTGCGAVSNMRAHTCERRRGRLTSTLHHDQCPNTPVDSSLEGRSRRVHLRAPLSHEKIPCSRVSRQTQRK